MSLTLGVGVCTPVSAAEWDDIPDLRGSQHAAVRKRFDGPRYNDFRSCYRRHRSKVGADYYSALVDVTEPGGSRSSEHADATPYATRVFDAWAGDGRVDPTRDVVIVAGVRNQSVGVRVADKWRDVGFDGPALQSALEAAKFRQLLSRNQYPDAMCTLLETIDDRLAALLEERAQHIGASEARLVAVRSTRSLILSRIDSRLGDEPFATNLRTQLDEALKGALDARGALDASAIDAATKKISEVQGLLTEYEQEMESLREVEQQMATLRGELETRIDDTLWAGRWTESLEELAQCERQAAELRAKFELEPTVVRDCLGSVQVAVGARERDELYQKVVLPLTIAVGVLLAMLAFVVTRMRRRQRALAFLQPELEDWERRAREVGEELTALWAAHGGAFDGWDGDWQGDSAGLDARVADAFNLAFLLHSETTNVLGTAMNHCADQGPLQARGFERALRTLRDTAITLPAGRDPRQPIPRPLDAPYQGTASTLRGDLLESVRHASQGLEELGEQLMLTETARREVAGAVDGATSAVKRREELGYPVDHLTDALNQAQQGFEDAQRAVSVDPIGAADLLAACAAQFDAVRERAAAGNAVIEDVSSLIDRAEQLRAKLSRAGDLAEPGFDPAADFEAAITMGEAALHGVSDGHEDAALLSSEALATSLERLDIQLDVLAEAEAVLPPMLDALDERREELKSKILAARIGLRRADEDYTDELMELTSLQSVLSRLGRMLEGLEQKRDAGHDLWVAGDVRSMVELCEQSARLVNEVSEVAGTDPVEARWPAVWYDSATARWAPFSFGSAPSAFGAPDP